MCHTHVSILKLHLSLFHPCLFFDAFLNYLALARSVLFSGDYFYISLYCTGNMLHSPLSDTPNSVLISSPSCKQAEYFKSHSLQEKCYA